MPPIAQTPTRSKALFLGAALLAACMLATALLGGEPDANAALGDPLDPPPPNIVLITTDDQQASTATSAVMPRLSERMAGGSSFSDYIVTTPLCCPSRASLLTGQYGHNNGVLQNDYALLRDKGNVLPVWLQGAGYSTAHVGKYLNRFGDFSGNPRTVAPGWDYWFTQFETKAYYEWRASKNGRLRAYGSEDADHLTVVTNRRAAAWARKLARKPEPFFMQLDYYAPHVAAGRGEPACRGAPVPAPADEGRASSLGLPNPPSFNELDVSDKPDFIQALPRMDPEVVATTGRRYRCMVESLASVDRGIDRVFRKIEAAGELDRTVFIFTSDNGYFYGEHRIKLGKPYPYEENLRMPLLVQVPGQYLRGGGQPRVIGASTANIDIAPTIAELAGVEPCVAGRCRTLDGRSLLPLLDGSGPWPAERSLLVERNNCDFRGIRSGREVYFEYGRGPIPTSGRCVPDGIEHYDLDTDPFQIENLFPAPRRSADGALQRDFQKRISTLAKCAGIPGRDPLPPSGTRCE